jgi:hypothetical protein
MLDAGYLWPMLQAQDSYPRLTQDRFTSVFSFLWFAILPMRGKVLPANGNGHELSVFIGPILAYCLWRYRHWLSANLPVTMKRPLIAVSLVSLVLGMGSLRALHVPVWLSPFDVLRPLPGFRSIGVTGRYWGFLALPLSLLGAAALWKYVSNSPVSRRLHLFLGTALVLQLSFQSETLSAHWWHSPRFQSVAPDNYFRGESESIEYVGMQDGQMQGEIMTPTRGVSNCYDMDDFKRPDSAAVGSLLRNAPAARVQFASWNRISVGLPCAATGDDPSCRVVLPQAYHEFWTAPGCSTRADAHGRLLLDCPASRVREGTVQLTFDDRVSDLGSRVSKLGWELWCWATLALLSGWAALQLRHGHEIAARGRLARIDSL